MYWTITHNSHINWHSYSLVCLFYHCKETNCYARASQCMCSWFLFYLCYKYTAMSQLMCLHVCSFSVSLSSLVLTVISVLHDSTRRHHAIIEYIIRFIVSLYCYSSHHVTLEYIISFHIHVATCNTSI